MGSLKKQMSKTDTAEPEISPLIQHVVLVFPKPGAYNAHNAT